MSDSDLDLLNCTSDEEEQQFALATDFVTRKADVYGAPDLLEFYALYKQALEGPCHTPRPTLLHLKARNKWNAWRDLGDMSNAEAQRAYVAKLHKLEPSWQEQCGSKHSGDGNYATGWVVHSIESVPAEDSKPEHEKTVFDHVKENNLVRLRQVLQPSDVTLLDEHGMGLLHWATDRNAVAIIEYLVVRGADVNQRDGEQQTALHYAASCGHVEALQYLLALNADMELRDADDQNCLDVADDEQVITMLRAEQNMRKA